MEKDNEQLEARATSSASLSAEEHVLRRQELEETLSEKEAKIIELQDEGARKDLELEVAKSTWNKRNRN